MSVCWWSLALGLGTGCNRVADEYRLVGSAFTETARVDWTAGLAGRYVAGAGTDRRRYHVWNLLCDEVLRPPDDRETLRLQADPAGGYLAVLERDGRELARRRLDLTPEGGLYRGPTERYLRIGIVANASGYRRLWLARDLTGGLLLARADAGTGYLLVLPFVSALYLDRCVRFAGTAD